MSARRLRFLKRVCQVQELYLSHKKEYISDAFIYKTYVEERFLIGLATFYRYLNINAKKELSDLLKKQAFFLVES